MDNTSEIFSTQSGVTPLLGRKTPSTFPEVKKHGAGLTSRKLPLCISSMSCLSTRVRKVSSDISSVAIN